MKFLILIGICAPAAAQLPPAVVRLSCSQDARKGDGALVQFRLEPNNDGTFDAIYDRSEAHGLGGTTPPESVPVHGLRCSFDPAEPLAADCRNAAGETFTTTISPAAPALGYPEKSVEIKLRYKDSASGSLRAKLFFSTKPSLECQAP